MTAPNAVWSALFVLVVAVAEYLFGHEAVATYGAVAAGVLSVLLRMWQERETDTIHTMSRSAGTRPGYWRRVLLG